jgi:hypothetical protein
MQPKSPEKIEQEDSESLFRKFVLPEEDKPERTINGWRWFRSENIVDLVRIRERGELRDGTQ